jgi:methylenetetrahydrofolate--tRNA-(uracil-5-)-methyltransferase
MVGFQTKLRHGEQTRVFRRIPGLERAEFARLGGLHRNTYLDAPRLLDPSLRLKAEPRLRFAGQITGCEGYVESAAIGFLAGCFAGAEQSAMQFTPPPKTTALGALLAHVTGGHLSGNDEGARSYQPMNINFGLFPPLDIRFRGRDKAREKKLAVTARAKADLAAWLAAARASDVAA